MVAVEHLAQIELVYNQIKYKTFPMITRLLWNLILFIPFASAGQAPKVIYNKDSILVVARAQGNAYFCSHPNDAAQYRLHEFGIDDNFVVYGYIKPSANPTDKWFKIIFKQKAGFVSYYCVNFTDRSLDKVDNSPNLGDSDTSAALAMERDFAELIKLADESNALADKEQRKVEEERAKAAKRELDLFYRIGFGIPDYGFNEDENSVGVVIDIINSSKKTIKYVSIDLAFFNRVNDPIGLKTVRGIGPIEPGEISTLSFEDVIYTKIFHSGKIMKAKIEYMDGTIKSLFGDDLGKVVRKAENRYGR